MSSANEIEAIKTELADVLPGFSVSHVNQFIVADFDDVRIRVDATCRTALHADGFVGSLKSPAPGFKHHELRPLIAGLRANMVISEDSPNRIQAERDRARRIRRMIDGWRPKAKAVKPKAEADSNKYKIPDIKFIGDLMQFDGCQFGPEKDYKGNDICDEMTVFIRRDEVRAVVPAWSGSIEIRDTHGSRFELSVFDGFNFESVFNRIVAWRVGSTVE